MKGDLEAVASYLALRRDLDVQDSKGITPLGYAIGADRVAVVKLLVQSLTDPSSVDTSGNSGLHYAAGYGRTELAEYFLESGVRPSECNAQGQTAVDVAIQKGHASVVEILQQQT